MKQISRKQWAVILLAVLFVGSAATAQQSTTLDRAEKAIPAELFEKTAKIAPPGTRHSIILVGENHASVKTQRQLASMLDALYAAKLVDAILIEGSNGPMPVSQIRDSVGKGNVASFWRGRLDLGQIAGYEYLALTQPGITVFGVEDMKAKRDYTVGAARRGVDESLTRVIETHEKSYRLAEKSLQQAPDGPRKAAAGRELEEYRKRIDALISARKTVAPRYAELEAQYTAAVEDVTLLYNKLRSVLPTIDALGAEQSRYQELLRQAKSYVSEGAYGDSASVKKLVRALEASKAKIEALTAKFNSAAQQSGYQDGAAAIVDLKKIAEVEAQLDPAKSTLTKDLSAAAERLAPIENNLTDQFFIVVNGVREALGKPISELQSFLHDERVRTRERDTDLEVPHLAERDAQMIANTLQYLRDHPNAQSVVLVIGYAHLGNLTKGLSDAGAGVLAGRVAASRDEVESWEIRAWNRRSRPATRVFSKEATRKELSRLLDPTFQEETAATLRKLNQLQVQGTLAIPSGKGRLFEVNSPGAGTKAVAVGNWAGMQEANWGAHIVDRGYLPNSSSNEQYLIFDRALANRQAKNLSTDHYLFVPSYRTRTGQGLVTRFETPAGPIGLEKFKFAPPKTASGKTPVRVVLLAEPDGGATYRSLQNVKSTKPAAAGGAAGGGKPPWTTTLAGFAAAPEPGKRPPGLFQTINAERAKAKLDALAKQEPLRWGEVASLRFGIGTGEASMMETLWFTPSRGDHARVYLIVGENTGKFRSELKIAAEAGLFRNKQVALASCFDPEETPQIREMLLEAGALVVWTPERKITPDAAEKLETYLQRAIQSTATSSRTIDEAIPDALKLWQRQNDSDPDLRSLIDASKWVRLFMSGAKPGLASLVPPGFEVATDC